MSDPDKKAPLLTTPKSLESEPSIKVNSMSDTEKEVHLQSEVMSRDTYSTTMILASCKPKPQATFLPLPNGKQLIR